MDDFAGGVQLSGPGMTPRFMLKRKRRTRRKTTIPKNMSKKSKQNLKRNLVTLGEKKWILRDATGLSATDTPVVVALTDIGQGDTDQSRDGDQLAIRSIEVNWAFITADVTNLCRLIVFQWYPATVPTSSNVLAYSGANILNPLAPYNHDSRFQFKILLDVRSTVSTNDAIRSYRRYIKGGMKRKIQYIAGSATAAANMIYVMYMSDSGLTTHPALSYSIKVNYNDY